MHIRGKFESNVGIIYPHEVKFDTIFDVPHVDEITTWISTSLKNLTVMEFQKLILSFSPTVYVRKNVRRYVRKNVRRYVKKICQKECQKICQKEW